MAAGLCCALALGVYLKWPRQYGVWTSPDGNYRAVAYYYPQLVPVMPGQGSDAPGLLELRDRSGKLLHRQKLEMVQLVYGLRWSSDSVSIPGLFLWNLP